MNKTVLLSGLDGDDKILVSHIMDLASKSEKTGAVMYSPFLNPREARLAKGYCKGAFHIEEFGGYGDAERVRLAFCPGDDGDVRFPICSVKITVSDGRELSHRDYMGAVLSLGIKREKIGDIVVCGESAVMMCCEEIADFICMNLTKVASSGVKCGVCGDDVRLERKYALINATVASMRLDCVLSAVLGKSREASSELIKSGAVQVNYDIAKDAPMRIKSGDTISARGFGKMIIEADGTETRKGRAKITVKKFI